MRLSAALSRKVRGLASKNAPLGRFCEAVSPKARSTGRAAVLHATDDYATVTGTRVEITEK